MGGLNPMKQVVRLAQDQEVVEGSSLAAYYSFFALEDGILDFSVTDRSRLRNRALYGEY